MAQRMSTIPPTEQRSLWTTLTEVVAPVLAMDSRVPESSDEDWAEVEEWLESKRTAIRKDSPKSHEVCPEANDFDVGAEIELATQSRSPPECMVPEKGRVLDIDLSRGIMESVSKFVKDHPGKRLKFKFGFSTDQIHEFFEKESNTLIRIFSCTNPASNMKVLVKAIENAFWTDLFKVDITVDGNELEMRYDSVPLFKSEVKAAESYIKSVVTHGRYQWLRFAQQKLIDRCLSNKTPYHRSECEEKLCNDLGLEKRGDEDEVEHPEELCLHYGPSPTDKALSTDWGTKLTGELIHLWLEGFSTRRKGSKIANLPFQWTFKCSGSSVEDIETTGVALGRFATNFKDVIRCLLRIYGKPPVIIRVTNSSDDTGLTGPLNHNTRIIQSTGDAEEYKISIYDADGPESRRVLSCRSSDFYTAFCYFLTATDE